MSGSSPRRGAVGRVARHRVVGDRNSQRIHLRRRVRRRAESADEVLHGWWRVFHLSYWPKSAGGDGYRPLTILAFRVEAMLGHLNPIVFHAVNIALYALAAWLVFLVAAAASLLPHGSRPRCSRCTRCTSKRSPTSSVSRSCGSRSPSSVRRRCTCATGWTDAPTVDRALILLLYAAACFAKEHGIVLPAISSRRS